MREKFATLGRQYYMMFRNHPRLSAALLVATCLACSTREPRPLDVQTAAAATVSKPAAQLLSQMPSPVARPRPAPRDTLPPLSPLADSIASTLVFAPTTQTWYTAAARGKRMLLDIGRVDARLRKNPERLVAFREAVERTSPVRIGARFRLRGPWGAEDARVGGFDTWNGRIVATLEASPLVDSLARGKELLAAAASPADSESAPVADTCARDSLSTALVDRAGFVRDSLEQDLRDKARPPFERLANHTRVQSTQVAGCFGVGRLLMIVSLRAGDNEWLQERVVVLSDSGSVTPLKTRDLRFKAHDALRALDADGDGVDDVAARAMAEAAGAIVILKLAEGQRLERLTSGFAWENR